MNPRIRHWGAAILLLLFTAVHGQESVSMSSWRLKDCIDYAREHNIQVSTQKLNTQIAGEQYLLTRAAILPDLYGSANQNLRHSGDGSNGGFSTNGSLGLNSSMALYRGGYLRDDIQERNLEVQSANLNLLTIINDITVQVTQAFLTILMDKESIIYARDLASTSQAQFNRAQQIFQAGSLSRKELLQTQAQLAQDQYNLTSAISIERRDRISLKQLLQLTDTAFDIAIPDTIVNSGIVTPFEKVKSTALSIRPEIKNAEVNVDIALKELDKAKAAAKPSLNLGGGIGSSYTDDPATSVTRQLDNNFYQQVGLTLSVPIFTKRVNRTNINVAKIGVEQSKLNLGNTQTVLELNIERAYVNVVNAQAQYDAAVTQVSSAKEVYNIVNEELRIGSIPVINMIVQRNQYMQALQNYLSAKYNAALAMRIYEFYMGVR
ncbi:MAG: transporter [Flavipsychrobacter sp.]|nr:transporter [Flavipsychrobacter sp.]